MASSATQSDVTDLPIGEAAHEVIDIERSAPLDGEFDITLGEAFGPELGGHFGRQEATGAVRLYRLREVTLDASLMLLLRGRSRITETRFFVTDQEYYDTLVKPLPAMRLDAKEHYIIGCNRAWHDYYHWLVQSLPAIDLSLRYSGHNSSTLVLSSLRPWQEKSLALLGYQDIPRLTLDVSNTFLLPSAEFSDFLGSRMPGMVARTAMATFRRLSRAVPWTRAAPEAIYVATAGTQHHRLENEAELIELLDGQGVQIVKPEDLSMAEQIAAFRAARLVIGAHGVGMSNIVFSQQGSFVYELLPRHYLSTTVNRLAQTAALNYWADIFGGADDNQERTWRVDLNSVAARLAAIRERIAVTPRRESALDFLRRTQAAHPDNSAAAPARTPVARAAPAATELPVSEATAPRRRGLARLFSRRGS